MSSLKQLKISQKDFIKFNVDLFEELRLLYKCPICLDIFDNPVTTLCSHTFCKYNKTVIVF